MLEWKCRPHQNGDHRDWSSHARLCRWRARCGILRICQAGDEPFTLCSWGAYDLNQLRQDCERHRLELPVSLEKHINLKQEFALKMNVRPCGMAKALRIAGLELEGTHHRGIDDARNIAKLARLILSKSR